MGVHVTFNRTCDRCGKPFDMQAVTYEKGLPALDPKPWVLTHAGKQVFSFEDLCPSCEGVFGKLVKRLTLDDEEKKKDDGASDGSKSKGSDEKTEPKVEPEIEKTDDEGPTTDEPKEEPVVQSEGDETDKDYPF